MRKSTANSKRDSKDAMRTYDTQAFEQSVLRKLKEVGAQKANVLVAVSGGIDSMVLLQTLKQWKNVLKITLTAVHIHHGPSKNKYRDKARSFVKKFCRENNIPFETNATRPAKPLKSEDELRVYRWSELNRVALSLARAVDSKTPTFIATAHHADDLIETQLMRLLRGTGAQGLKGFSAKDGIVIRPLIELPKQTIFHYAKAKKIKFIADPSNEQADPLRNWLRQTWLKDLALRDRANGTNTKKSLAGSFLALSHELAAKKWPETLFSEDPTKPNAALHLPTFLQLAKSDKEAALAQYMYHQNLKNYSRRHISEILKRLDTSKKELTFSLLGREWHINAQHITVGA